MKRPRRTYRLHSDYQHGIDALAEYWELGRGEALERAIEPELRAAFGQTWREQVRGRRRSGESGATGHTANGEAAPGAPDGVHRGWLDRAAFEQALG